MEGLVVINHSLSICEEGLGQLQEALYIKKLPQGQSFFLRWYSELLDVFKVNMFRALYSNPPMILNQTVMQNNALRENHHFCPLYIKNIMVFDILLNILIKMY